jgi:hypothetical protein
MWMRRGTVNVDASRDCECDAPHSQAMERWSPARMLPHGRGAGMHRRGPKPETETRQRGGSTLRESEPATMNMCCRWSACLLFACTADTTRVTLHPAPRTSSLKRFRSDDLDPELCALNKIRGTDRAPRAGAP